MEFDYVNNYLNPINAIEEGRDINSLSEATYIFPKSRFNRIIDSVLESFNIKDSCKFTPNGLIYMQFVFETYIVAMLSNAKKISDGGDRIFINGKDIEKLNDFYDMKLELSEPILERQHDQFYDKIESNNDDDNSEDSEDSDN